MGGFAQVARPRMSQQLPCPLIIHKCFQDSLLKWMGVKKSCSGTEFLCTEEAETRWEFTGEPSSGHGSERGNVQHTNTRIAFAEPGSVLVMCVQSWDSVVTRGGGRKGRKEGWALLPLPLGLAGRTGRDFYTGSLNKQATHSASQWPIQNPFKLLE